MSFFSWTIFLFLLGIIDSLAAVLGSIEPNDVLSKLSPNVASGNGMFDDASYSPFLTPGAKPPPNDVFSSSPPFAADVTTSPHDVLVSDSADGTPDGAIVSNPGNNPLPNSASAECNSNTPPNAKRRVRRDDDDFCTIQSSSDTKEKTAEVDSTHNSPEQNGRHPGEQQDNRVNLGLSLDEFKPRPIFKIPQQNFEMCPTPTYGDLNIPMCDSGNRRRDVKLEEKTLATVTLSTVKYYKLDRAHPCTSIFPKMALSPILSRGSPFVSGGGGRRK